MLEEFKNIMSNIFLKLIFGSPKLLAPSLAPFMFGLLLCDESDIYLIQP